MNTKSLSARDARALAIIDAGGRLVTALRRSYGGGEKQAYWVEDAHGRRVSGFGFRTFHNLVDSGMVKRDRGTLYGSTCRRVFVADKK